MIVKRQIRAKKIPGTPTLPKDISEQDQKETFERLDKARKKRPVRKPTVDVRFMGETVKVPKPELLESLVEEPIPAVTISDHHLRKKELSRIHGIPETDIFVDPVNGVELYRTVNGGWVNKPEYRGVE